jgi:hypothetical protein
MDGVANWAMPRRPSISELLLSHLSILFHWGMLTLQMPQMQDIGGCRAVLSNMGRVDRLRFMYEANPLRHRLARTRD